MINEIRSQEQIIAIGNYFHMQFVKIFQTSGKEIKNHLYKASGIISNLITTTSALLSTLTPFKLLFRVWRNWCHIHPNASGFVSSSMSYVCFMPNIGWQIASYLHSWLNLESKSSWLLYSPLAWVQGLLCPIYDQNNWDKDRSLTKFLKKVHWVNPD